MTSARNTKATQEFVPIKEIRDGVVILKDGSLRLVLIASSINFYLKSEDERTGIITQYQDFLNSLDFPIQISMASRRLDIKPYLMVIEEQLKVQTNELIKLQIREYIEFIKNTTETTNIMNKTFYVVVPYELAIIGTEQGGFLGKLFGSKPTAAQAEQSLKQFQERKTQIEQRASVVEQGLNHLGIRVAQLGTEELVELYYKAFNPGETAAPSLDGISQAGK